jgi:hypothetical protein
MGFEADWAPNRRTVPEIDGCHDQGTVGDTNKVDEVDRTTPLVARDARPVGVMSHSPWGPQERQRRNTVSRPGVPELDHLVAACRDHPGAVGAVGTGPDKFLVPL